MLRFAETIVYELAFSIVCEFPGTLLGNTKKDKVTSVPEYSDYWRTTDVTETTDHPGRSSRAV